MGVKKEGNGEAVSARDILDSVRGRLVLPAGPYVKHVSNVDDETALDRWGIDPHSLPRLDLKATAVILSENGQYAVVRMTADSPAHHTIIVSTLRER